MDIFYYYSSKSAGFSATYFQLGINKPPDELNTRFSPSKGRIIVMFKRRTLVK